MTDVIKHYKILSTLGRGGMGIVYSARDERLGRIVAIKTIAGAARDPVSRQRLWREARAAASVNHPHVCQIYEVDEHEGELFIAMELLEGEPLSSRIAAGAMPLADAVQMALAILSALEALHGRGIIHRDLKPSNVFLTAHGVKLLDFGLARPRALDRDATEENITASGLIIGTPRYIAPEMWDGEPATAASDLFATGALLYEALTGRPAFGGGSILEIAKAIAHEHPPALAGGPAASAVDRVIQRALEKRPESRHPTARAMADELRAALLHVESGEPARVRPIMRLIVLPFRVLRADPETDFLAFSVPDAITASLAGIETLVVRSSAAAARYASGAPDIRTLAAEAEVDAALLGSILRAGDEVRVSAQLVAAPDGTLIWSGNAQRPLRDLFDLQDQLSRQIVESLAIPLSARERRQLNPDVPASARAYEFYLRANQLMQDSDMLPVARDLYRSCVEEDPRYAPAWARLGRVARILAKYRVPNAQENRRLAETAFDRALELNPDLGIAHNYYTYFEIEELGRAPAAMVRLIERAHSRPSDPELFAGLVAACRFCGLLEASLVADARARRLDPAMKTSVSYTHFMLGNYKEAAELHDDSDLLYSSLAMMGRVDEAIRGYSEMAIAESRISDYTAAYARVVVAALRHDVEGARRERALLATSSLRDPEAFYSNARAYAYVGLADEALEAFRRTVEGGYTCHAGFVRDPWLDPLRTDPEFARSLRVAQERQTAAAADYARVGGERLLGVPAR